MILAALQPLVQLLEIWIAYGLDAALQALGSGTMG